MKAITYHIEKRNLSGLRIKLLQILDNAGYEPFGTHIEWRINDRLESYSTVTVVAYNTGSVVISGHGTKFDLASSFVKTYDIGNGQNKKPKTDTRRK